MKNSNNNSKNVEFDKHGFKLNGERQFIYGGELHYFRVPPSQWKDRLTKCKRAFFNSVGIYFAWNWHEQEKGKFIFDKDRDVEKWLSIINELGMFGIARPGPYICSEWDLGGIPNWALAENADFRSADENYLSLFRDWFKEINKRIKPLQITSGGNLYLYQIENEHWWNNPAYMEKLEQFAQQDGIDIPFLTNSNGKLPVFGSKHLDSITSYPKPWDVDDTYRHLNHLFRLQPDMPKMIIELEGGWFTHFGGLSPTCRGYITHEWTDVYLKALIAQGVNAMNIYMFHGGTNPGYWTGTNITTTYDWDASIREWGELSERYFVVRRIGAFLESLGKEIAESKVNNEIIVSNPLYCEVLALTSSKGSFIFPRNLTSRNTSVKISFKHPDTDEIITLPRKNDFNLPAYSMSVIPVDINLSGGIKLKYCTSQVFNYYEQNSYVNLFLYERPGFKGEIVLEVDDLKGYQCDSKEEHNLEIEQNGKEIIIKLSAQ